MKDTSLQTDERKEFARRLNLVLDVICFPAKGRGIQVALARKSGVFQKGAHKWVEGESIPDTKRIPGIVIELGVWTEWLLSGVGPMRPGDAYEQAGSVNESRPSSLTPDEQKLLETYRHLTKRDKEMLQAASAALVQMLEILEVS